MKQWTAVVLARPETDGSPILSRLPSYLHPVAGRPLIWHTVNAIAGRGDGPRKVIVVGPPELGAELFEGIAAEVLVSPLGPGGERTTALPELTEGPVVLVHGAACFDGDSLARLLNSRLGSWASGSDGQAAGLLLAPEDLPARLDLADPLGISFGALDPELLVPETEGTFIVETRAELARAHRRVRDHLVRALMEGGVTFILPDSNLVDVDVRIGRDTVVYPGVMLEGQTTVGDETVIGPSCRIIDSWIGSGVELKGWNYIAHTSVRNRAILEPYVRRGFD